MALADHADETGACWPSINRLQQHTALCERAVQGALRRLTGMGAIVAGRRVNKSTIWTISGTWQGQPPQQVHPALNAPRIKCTPPPQQVHPTPALNAPRTVIEPSDEPSIRRAVPKMKGGGHDGRVRSIGKIVNGEERPSRKRQDHADRDMAELLASRFGYNPSEAWMAIMAARDGDKQALDKLSAISRQHRLGWFGQEKAVPP